MYIQAVFMMESLVNNSEKYFSYVYSLSNGKEIRDSELDKIEAFENTERIVHCDRSFIDFNMPLGGGAMIPIYMVSQEDMKFIVDNMELELKEGKLPENENEIILHEKIARSKSYKVGDIIGTSYKLTGILKGDSLMSFIPYSDIKNSPKMSLLVFHMKDKVYETNDFLINNIKSGDIGVKTYKQLKQQQVADNNQMNMVFNIVQVIIVIGMTLAIVNLNYVQFFNRRREFGILHAVGYSRRHLVKRAFNEMFVLQSIAYISGIIMALAAGVMLKIMLFDKKGMPIEILNPKSFLQTIVIPIFMSIFNIIPVSRMLSKTDAIAAIQGND
jgi:ABC-type antimicrobial peptide transport system permease subunit